MPTAFIVRVARTAAGKRNGALSHYHPAVLGAKVVDALVDRAAFDPSVVVVDRCECEVEGPCTATDVLCYYR